MRNEFVPKAGDASTLSHDDRHRLESVIIPKAEQWMREYSEGTPLWSHGRQTLAYWGRLIASGAS